MNTNHEPGSTGHGDAGTQALRAALAALREDRPPPRDLWSGIAARMQRPLPADHARELPRAAPLAMLGGDAAPARDFWPEIEARIRAARWRRLRTPLSAAAGLAASLVLALGLQVYRGGGATPGATAAARAPLRASPEVLAAMQAATPADAALRPVSALPLNAETRALVRANLKIVASAETQLKRALATDPDAAYLQSLLDSTRQQKQDLRYALAEQP